MVSRNSALLALRSIAHNWCVSVGSKHVNFKVPSELHDNEQSAAANVTQQHQDKRRPWDLLSRHEFLRYCVRLFRDHSKGKLQAIRQDGRITLGMVGYPNVGKSSTINALCESKRVSVAPTPGHTKHFQARDWLFKSTLRFVCYSMPGVRADMG